MTRLVELIGIHGQAVTEVYAIIEAHQERVGVSGTPVRICTMQWHSNTSIFTFSQ